MIEKGQIYRSIKPTASMPGNHHRRIKLVGKPMTTPGVYGFGSVMVVTLEEGGRGVRMRPIKMSELHSSSTTSTGEPRRNGYVLEGS